MVFGSSRNEAVAGALKALFFNKIGDFSLFFAILAIFLSFGTFDIALVNSLVWFLDSNVGLLFISFFCFDRCFDEVWTIAFFSLVVISDGRPYPS